jgi:hypothetical protein
MAVLGLGMAIAVAPLATTVMGAVADRHAGVASGINNATSRVAGMLAVALLGAVAVGVFGASLDGRATQLQLAPAVRSALEAQVPRLAEAEPPAQASATEREALVRALDESLVASFRVVVLASAGLALLSAACARLTIGPADGDPARRPTG